VICAIKCGTHAVQRLQLHLQSRGRATSLALLVHADLSRAGRWSFRCRYRKKIKRGMAGDYSYFLTKYSATPAYGTDQRLRYAYGVGDRPFVYVTHMHSVYSHCP
jgi:hypothetical protein